MTDHTYEGSAHAIAHGERLAPEERRERIDDPTVKTNLPRNLLLALGNAHVNLQTQVVMIKELLDELGWPDRNGEELFDFYGPPLATALDFARENARLTWVLCGLVSALRETLGSVDRDDHGEVLCIGPCEACRVRATAGG